MFAAGNRSVGGIGEKNFADIGDVVFDFAAIGNEVEGDGRALGAIDIG